MIRERLVVASVVLASIAAGAFVATLAPSSSVAVAAELNLAPPPASAPAINTPSFADLAEKTIPSVVAITSQKLVDVRTPHDMFFDNPLLRRFFRGEPFGDDQTPQQPKKQRRLTSGSGFFITDDGYILTNRHVVEDAENLFVRTSDMPDREEGLPAKLVGTDPFGDVALIKIEGKNYPALPLGDSDKLRVGDWVMAIGNPLLFRNSVTVGVVSGKGRQLDFNPSNLEYYIQTDAAINFGNSGGPLINTRGEVVGINTAIVRDSPGTDYPEGYVQGLGFALPMSPVKRVLNQLVSTGTVRRGRIGVSVQPVDQDRAEYLGAPSTKGAYVQSVEKGSPADKAGVRADDIILAVDGKKIGSSEDLVADISSRRPGDKVTLIVWRERKEFQTTLTLAERTNGKNEPEATSKESPEKGEDTTALGFTVGPPSPGLREHLSGLNPPVKGVMITDVDPDSAAANRGLAEGMIVVSVDGQPTPTVDAYRRAAAAVKSGAVVRLGIFEPRTGDEVTVFFRAPARK